MCGVFAAEFLWVTRDGKIYQGKLPQLFVRERDIP
jgi:hypothetical protein